METPAPALTHCPHCLAPNLDGEEHCQDCGRSLILGNDPPARLPRRIGLGSMMWVIALIAVYLVVLRESLGAGVIILVIGAPALFRTIQWSALRTADRQPMALHEKAGAFLVSIALVFLLIMMAVGGMGVVVWLGNTLFGSFLFAEAPLPIDDPRWRWLTVPAFVLSAVAVAIIMFYTGWVLWSLKTYRSG